LAIALSQWQNKEEQTIQWPKQRSTDNTMAKTKKYKQYNGQNKEVQTIQWPKQRRTPLYCLYFFVLAIVLFVLLCFGHCIVCTSLFWPLYCLFFFVLAIVLSVFQSKEAQTIQWPKQRSTNNTMAKAKKNRQYNGQNKEVQTIQ
jgi:preprotein translocase subunit SecE